MLQRSAGSAGLRALAGGADEGHQGERCRKKTFLRPTSRAYLACCLHEGRGLDIADGTTDFVMMMSGAFQFRCVTHTGLDFVGNVRDDLDGVAEVFRRGVPSR